MGTDIALKFALKKLQFVSLTFAFLRAVVTIFTLLVFRCVLLFGAIKWRWGLRFKLDLVQLFLLVCTVLVVLRKVYAFDLKYNPF